MKKIDPLKVKVSADKQSGEFKRPDHPDFMDSAELKKAKWSGLRMNSLTHASEIWLEGEIKATVTPQQLQINPMAINDAYIEVFALDSEVMPDTVLSHAYQDTKDRAYKKSH